MSRSDRLLKLFEDADNTSGSKTNALTDLAGRDDKNAGVLRMILYYDAEQLAALVTRNGLRDVVLNSGSSFKEFERQLDKHIDTYTEMFDHAVEIAKDDDNVISDLVMDKLREVYRTMHTNLEKIRKEVKGHIDGGSDDLSKTYKALCDKFENLLSSSGQGSNLSIPSKQQFLKAVQNNQI